jgi:hypothetical protein
VMSCWRTLTLFTPMARFSAEHRAPASC